MENIKINIIPFSHPQEEYEFHFTDERERGYFPIRREELPQELLSQIGGEVERLYGTTEKTDYTKFSITVKAEDSPMFLKHYYNHLIFSYFKSKAKVVTKNFVGDTEAWFLSKDLSTRQYWAFKRYTIKVQYERVTNHPEISVSYDGVSSIVTKSVDKLHDFPPEEIRKVVFKGSIYNYQKPPQWLKQNITEIYPKLNRALKNHLGIDIKKTKVDNRFIPYFNEINWLLDNHLSTTNFKSIIPLVQDDYVTFPSSEVLKTTAQSNEILFGNNQTGTVPKMDFGKKGPFATTPLSNVRVLFIYHQGDKEKEVTKLFQTMVKGVKKPNKSYYMMPPINEYIRHNLYLKESTAIVLNDQTSLIDQLRAQLKKLDSSKNRYVAMYIAPQSKESLSIHKPQFYYQLKEELLKHEISSQVMLKDTINDVRGFPWSMNNIGIAMLAKLNGIPWRLNRMINDELIVGVGAFMSASKKAKYIGNAFCFNNKGVFENFNCFRSDDMEQITGSIRKAIMKYKIDYGENAKRLVIHFYKKMSERELEPIMKMLNDFNWNIPVITITINKTDSNDYVGFDMNTQHLMPLSGTILPIGQSQYLLFNNSHYNPKFKVSEFNFPLKLTFSCTVPAVIEDKEVIQELTDQVYQFSRMYWKSNRQQNLPVTIKYPEMVAELFSHFEGDTLPEFGRRNLWFL
jgi:hypothetical protein